VEAGEHSLALFYVDEHGRHSIKQRGQDFAIGDRVVASQALVEEARSTPEHFSPNVLLRPLVQDRLFPTVCYVSGPSELAYQAQLKHVYEDFGVEPPLLYSRATATLLDSASVRFLDRHHLPFEALHSQDDSRLNDLLKSQLPPGLEQALADTGEELQRRASLLKTEVAALDSTLRGAVDTTVEHMRRELETLQSKIIQAAKRKDETLRRQFDRTRHLAFPQGHSQERVVNLAFVLNRYGTAVGDRLIEALPLDTSNHYLLTL
jgi:uncharacterized protein YllA (UPF0747 family)